MEPNPKKIINSNLTSILKERTNVTIFRECLLFTRFKDLIRSKVENGEMLKYLMQRRLEYKNLAKVLRYLNRMINAIYSPEIIK